MSLTEKLSSNILIKKNQIIKFIQQDQNNCNFVKSSGGGNYEPNEVKSGKWINHHDNYCNKCLITYHGVYKNGLRSGLWQTVSEDIEIGNYNEKGEKSDEWIEIHHNYDNYCQVIYSGTYKDGIKIGFWKILSEEQELYFLYIIIEVGATTIIRELNMVNGLSFTKTTVNQFKHYKIYQQYNFANTVKYSGIYQCGIKTGKWITLLGDEEIGGGNYDEQGIKSGHWIDLHDNYQEDNPIRYSGEYTKGLRTGVWEVYEEKKKISAAGGFYNEKGFKSGPWIDIHDEYCFLCRLFYSGEYDNGIKIGNWKTLFDEDQTYVLIHGSGGGNYNEKGAKTGEWIELHEKYYEQCPVKYRGKYEDGIRTGKWATLSEGLEIGGGSYNENRIKTVPWIDLHDNYYNGCKVKHSGEYTNGQRTGQWEIIYNVKQLGGGSYDEMGAKTGQWIELHENFYDFCRLVQAGEYKSGVKIGKWTILQDQKQMYQSVFYCQQHPFLEVFGLRILHFWKTMKKFADLSVSVGEVIIMKMELKQVIGLKLIILSIASGFYKYMYLCR